MGKISDDEKPVNFVMDANYYEKYAWILKNGSILKKSVTAALSETIVNFVDKWESENPTIKIPVSKKKGKGKR